MYRILIVGAVVSTAIVFQTHLAAGEATPGAQLSHEHNARTGSAMVQVFDETKKTFMEDKPSSAALHIILKNIPMIPTEKNIQNFPLAISDSELDSDKITQYYQAVAQAYEQEAHRTNESILRAYEAKTRNQQQDRLNAYRNENIKYADDYTIDKGTYSTISPRMPFKSGKYTPSTIRRDAQIFQNTEYREQKALYDELMLKSQFYLALANAMSPQPEVTE